MDVESLLELVLSCAAEWRRPSSTGGSEEDRRTARCGSRRERLSQPRELGSAGTGMLALALGGVSTSQGRARTVRRALEHENACREATVKEMGRISAKRSS